MLTRVLAYMKGLIRRDAIDAEVSEELRFHVEMETQANIDRGMTPQEARRVALCDLGGVTQTRDSVRSVRTLWIESLWQDVRYAARLLARSPGFAIVAVMTIALAIGANTAIFSLTDAVLLHPLRVPDADRLVSFAQWYPNVPEPISGFLYNEVLRFRSHLRSFEGIAAEGTRLIGVGDEDGTRRASVLFVSSNYFDVIGVRPRLGRWFLPDEEREDAPPTAVLSFAAWQRWFNGDPAVVGKSLRLTGVQTTVVGVAPRGFQGTRLGYRTDVFVPVLTATTVAARRENFFSDHAVDTGDGMNSPSKWLRVVGRLRPGVSRVQAEAEVRVFAASSATSRSRASATLSLLPAAESALYGRDRTSNTKLAWLLAGIVGLVLLVGCAGLAGLMLAQTEKRRHEFAARLAIGASGGRLLRQHLTETALLVCLGCAAGLLVSTSILRVLAQFPLPGLAAIHDVDPRLNGYVLAFTIATAFVTALLCGAVPAWRGSFAHDLASSLKAVGRTTAHGRSRLQAAVLVVQIALTLVLLVGASLFVRSVQAGFRTDLGFRPDGLITADLNPRLRRYNTQRATALIDDLARRLKALPGVRSVSVGTPPLSGFALSGPTLEADGVRKRVQPYVGISIVDDRYFETLGIRIVRGRSFGQYDNAQSRPVAVVNEALARALWADENATGHRITKLPVAGSLVVPQAEVVGVAANARVTLFVRGTPVLYLLRAQNPIFNADATSVTVRLDHDPQSFATVLRQHVRAVDRDLPVITIATMTEQIEKQLATQRMGAWLTGWFSLLALTLAVIGTYGIVAYTLARRTSEIGLRIALGAPPSRMPLLMMRIGLLPVVVGVAIGVAAAWPTTRMLKAFLFGVPPQDPFAFVAAPVLLTTVAVGASYVAARRASRVDPVETLRAE